MLDTHYKNLIFTRHSLERLAGRTLNQYSIHDTVNYPDDKKEAKAGQVKFIKTVNNRQIHVVAKLLPDQQKWLIISAWVRGEEDKEPLTWQIISLPFKLIYKLFQTLFSQQHKK